MSQAKGWIKVSEAAEALGVSPATVRRRIGKGELEGRKDQSGVWVVRLEQDEAAETEPLSAESTGDDCGCREDLERYQKLAGASVMLAQRRADAAEEAMVRSRAVVHQLRRVAWVTGGAAAAVMVLSCGLLIGLGAWGGSASAEAEANRQALQSARTEARDSRLEAINATREAARLSGKLEALEQQVVRASQGERTEEVMASVRRMPGG